jgi:3',5'-cyclic AMP phosphodiesterase CpdA
MNTEPSPPEGPGLAGCCVVIRDTAGGPAGLGVLVSQTEVLTCAHVVNCALARLDEHPDPPEQPLRISRPLVEAGTEVEIEVQVRDWSALGKEDLATLVLQQPLPPGAAPAKLGDAVPASNRQLPVFGYPEGRPKGQRTEVRIVGRVEGGWLQLNTADDVLPNVRAGYSGSPVYDPVAQEVVALVTQAPPEGPSRDCLAVPAWQLRRFLHVLAAVTAPGARAAADATARKARPERRYAPARELTVLQLSDLGFGPTHDSLFARLREDLAKLADGQGLWPDLVVVTGDLTRRGLRSEFEQATAFLEQLCTAVGLPRHRVAIVPGNHDVNRLACEEYFLREEAEEREPQPPFRPKWRHYAEAFRQFYADLDLPDGATAAVFSPERHPWTLFEMPELKVVVAGLNSTMADSHRDDDHYGLIGEDQLGWFAERLRSYRDKGWLVLGAVHHPVVPTAGSWTQTRHDLADLDRLLGHQVPGYPEAGPGPVHLFLHGHTHDGRLHRSPSGLLAVSIGSAALTAAARPAEVPRQYQLVTVRPDGLTRHLRAYLPDRRTWTGDNRADPVHDAWTTTEPTTLPAPAALTARSRTEDPSPSEIRDSGPPEPRIRSWKKWPRSPVCVTAPPRSPSTPAPSRGPRTWSSPPRTRSAR